MTVLPRSLRRVRVPVRGPAAWVLALLLAAPGVSAAPGAAPDGAKSLGAAPPLAARDLDGKPFDLARRLDRGPVLVTFWATWCKPCRKELPELQKLLERYRDRGFGVVAVGEDGPVDAAKVAPYVRASKFTFTVIPDPDGDIRRRFQVEALPTAFLIGRDGEVVHRQMGYRRGDQDILERELGKILPAAAPAEGGPPPSGEGR